MALGRVEPSAKSHVCVVQVSVVSQVKETALVEGLHGFRNSICQMAERIILERNLKPVRDWVNAYRNLGALEAMGHCVKCRELISHLCPLSD